MGETTPLAPSTAEAAVATERLAAWVIGALTAIVIAHQAGARPQDRRAGLRIAELLEHGLLRGSFVPPPVIRDLRELTRYRRTQIQDRTRVANRLHKVLQDANVKLSNVTHHVLGVSGRAMLDALVAGTTDPDVLADLARGQLRKKLPALRQALTSRFRAHHAFLLGQILAHLDYLEEAIAAVSGAGHASRA